MNTIDPVCHTALLGNKATGVPASYYCPLTGTTRSTPSASIVDRNIRRALVTLGMTNFYTPGDPPRVRWDRLVIGGHSQGASLSFYIGMQVHALAGVAAIAGQGYSGYCSPLPKCSAATTWTWLPWVTAPPKTPLARIKEFEHRRDFGLRSARQFAAMRAPATNLRLTSNTGPQCNKNPHSCVAYDSLVPTAGGHSVFLDDWVWLTRTGPCVPKTCASLGATCGNPDDGCGRPLSCGTCAAPKTCGARTPYQCGCAHAATIAITVSPASAPAAPGANIAVRATVRDACGAVTPGEEFICLSTDETAFHPLCTNPVPPRWAGITGRAPVRLCAWQPPDLSVSTTHMVVCAPARNLNTFDAALYTIRPR